MLVRQTHAQSNLEDKQAIAQHAAKGTTTFSKPKPMPVHHTFTAPAPRQQVRPRSGKRPMVQPGAGPRVEARRVEALMANKLFLKFNKVCGLWVWALGE